MFIYINLLFRKGEKRMKTMGLICCIATILFYVADLILGIKYCSAGFMGYPDVWSNKKAEKMHIPLSILMIISGLLTVIFALIATS